MCICEVQSRQVAAASSATRNLHHRQEYTLSAVMVIFLVIIYCIPFSVEKLVLVLLPVLVIVNVCRTVERRPLGFLLE